MSNISQSLAAQIDQLATQYQTISQKNIVAARHEVQAYSQNLITLKDQYANIKPVPLTIPAIFGKQYEENFISNYLAYILNPRQNGLGVAPLAKLFELCGLDPLEYPLEDVNIHREYPLDGGRIDLLFEWEDSLVVGIENKIFSYEGTGQTLYYAKSIAKIFIEIPHHLIYLTRDGHKARSKEFQPISYAQLWQVFKEIPLPVDIQPRQQVLWEDFLEHLEIYIMSGQPDKYNFSDKALLYMKHYKMVEDLRETFKQEWKQAVNYIGQRLSELLNDHTWEIRFNGSNSWQAIFKSSWTRADLSIHYEYFFSHYYWEKREFAFMVDVEDKLADSFITLFEQRYERIKPEYKRKEIQFRPANRKIAIAWKVYPLEQDIEKIIQAFFEAYTEFQFLENEIDATLAEWEARQVTEALSV